VTRFGTEPLAIMALKMAFADVIATGISKDIFVGFGLRNSLAAPSNDDDQLDFVIQGRGLRRPDNIASWTNEPGWKLREYDRLLRNFRARFSGVGSIIDTDTEYLRTFLGRKRRAQMKISFLQDGTTRRPCKNSSNLLNTFFS